MKPLYFLATLPFIFSLPACNKDDNNNPNGTKLLDFYTEELNPNTTTFTYNSEKQIVKEENSEEINTIDIIGNKLHYTEYRKTESRTTADATFNLNAAGNIESGHGTFSYSATSPYTSEMGFTYDSEGNLIHRADARSDGMIYTYDYAWTNGDITTVTWNVNGSPYLTITQSYDLNKMDKLKISSIQFLMQMNAFVGNVNQHLIKHAYTVYAPGTTVDQRIDFSWTLDADGYPTTQNITFLDASSSDVVRYYYK
jgi:hypothetical protein